MFQSVPYAVPPVGNRRWTKPLSLHGSTCWRGTLKTINHPEPCVQRKANSDVIKGKYIYSHFLWT